MKMLVISHIIFLSLIQFLLSCGPAQKKENHETVRATQPTPSFSLEDFYSDDPKLKFLTDSVLNDMTNEQMAGQMIVQAAGRLGKPDNTIARLIQRNMIGGVLLLNGSVEGFKQKVHFFDSLANASGTLPLIYSSDAEPSLVNMKIKGSQNVPNTIELNTIQKNKSAANTIVDDLKHIGITHNYAPVLDISPDNAAIKNRSYGYNSDSVVILGNAFAETLEANGIAATVKHFPGHGLVKGDSHSRLVYIDGEMKEVEQYRPFIKYGITSIMVGHIAVRNNAKYDTEGLPASCSEKIVTDLLKNELGFKGIVITDAMNMGAVSKIDNADFMAVEAGNDMILMPGDEEHLINQMVYRMNEDGNFKERIKNSARKIIRLKICLGLL